MVFHLLAPSAMAPSRKARGTARRNSSVLRRVMGIIIRPSAKPPASVEKCLNGQNHQAIGENSDDDGGHAIQKIGGVAHDESEPCRR